MTTLCKSYDHNSNHTFSPYGSWVEQEMTSGNTLCYVFSPWLYSETVNKMYGPSLQGGPPVPPLLVSTCLTDFSLIVPGLLVCVAEYGRSDGMSF